MQEKEILHAEAEKGVLCHGKFQKEAEEKQEEDKDTISEWYEW